MPEVSLFRLYFLRAMYLFTVVGFGMYLLPNILHHSKPWEFWEGIVQCMLLTFWLLSVLGIRYPLQMLPVMLWEIVWKVLWYLMVALPQYQSGHMDDATVANAITCAPVLLLIIAMPWRYVFQRYVKQAGDPWSKPSSAGAVLSATQA